MTSFSAIAIPRVIVVITVFVLGLLLSQCNNKGTDSQPLTEAVPKDSIVFREFGQVTNIAANKGKLYVIVGHTLYTYDTAKLAAPVDSFIQRGIIDYNSYLFINSTKDLGFVGSGDSTSILRLDDRGHISVMSRVHGWAYGYGKFRMTVMDNTLIVFSQQQINFFDISNPASPTLRWSRPNRGLLQIVAADSLIVATISEMAPSNVVLLSKELIVIERVDYSVDIIGMCSPSESPTVVLGNGYGNGMVYWMRVYGGRLDTLHAISHDFGSDVTGLVQAGSYTIVQYIDGLHLVVRATEKFSGPERVFSFSNPKRIIDACVQGTKLYVADSSKVVIYELPQ